MKLFSNAGRYGTHRIRGVYAFSQALEEVGGGVLSLPYLLLLDGFF